MGQSGRFAQLTGLKNVGCRMDNKDEKTTRTYTESLSEYYMTAKEIAELWNRETEYANGEIGILVQRKGKKDKNKAWQADDISKLFTRILDKWGLAEYRDMFRFEKYFHLEKFEEKLNDVLKMLELYTKVLGDKKEAHTYKALKQGLQDTVEWLKEERKHSPQGKYIFNKEGFVINKCSGKVKRNLLYDIYCLYCKKEKCTIEEINRVSWELVYLIPDFRSADLKEIFTLFGKDSDKRFRAFYNDFFGEYLHRDMVQIQIERKLCRYFRDDKVRFQIGDRWLVKKDEWKELYPIQITIMDYVVDKYIFLLISIDKVRKIEKEIYSSDEELSGSSIYNIGAAYLKSFKYEMDNEMASKIKKAKNEADVNYIMDELRCLFESYIENDAFITEDEMEEIILDFVHEMDELMEEAPIYNKLMKLIGNEAATVKADTLSGKNTYILKKERRDRNPKLSEQDLKNYFQLMKNKENMTRKLIKTEQDEIGLKIIENDDLREAVNFARTTCKS